MHYKLKAIIQEALNTIIDEAAEENYWEDYYIHPELINQMTEAACLVFDSAINGQKFDRECSDI